MSDRADVLGALLDGEALVEGNVFEQMQRSNANVSSQVAAERKKLGSLPGPSSFEAQKHPRGGKGTSQGGKFIKAGSSGTPVKEVQKRLGVQQTGSFAFDTEAAVKNFQRERGLQVDGVVGRQTAQALLGNRNAKVISPGVLSTSDAKALGVSVGKKKATKARAPVRIGGGVWI